MVCHEFRPCSSSEGYILQLTPQLSRSLPYAFTTTAGTVSRAHARNSVCAPLGKSGKASPQHRSATASASRTACAPTAPSSNRVLGPSGQIARAGTTASATMQGACHVAPFPPPPPLSFFWLLHCASPCLAQPSSPSRPLALHYSLPFLP